MDQQGVLDSMQNHAGQRQGDGEAQGRRGGRGETEGDVQAVTPWRCKSCGHRLAKHRGQHVEIFGLSMGFDEKRGVITIICACETVRVLDVAELGIRRITMRVAGD